MVGRPRGGGVQIERRGWGGGSDRGSSGGDSKWRRSDGAWRNPVDYLLFNQMRGLVDPVFHFTIRCV